MKKNARYFLYSYFLFILSLSGKLYAQDSSTEENNAINFSIESMLSDLISTENIKPYLSYFKRNEILRWQVTLPENHAAQSPQGLLVYISPQNSGKIYEGWKPLLTKKNLIWIAADEAGNGFSAQRRVLQALLALQLASKKYSIDKQRIYIAGFSGGGRVVSMMAPLYPEMFTGSIFIGGANDWGSKLPEKISLMRKSSYVFINGDSDFNLKESKKVFAKFKQSGISNLEFIEVPGLGHSPPDTNWLVTAIDFLDDHKSND